MVRKDSAPEDLIPREGLDAEPEERMVQVVLDRPSGGEKRG